MITGYFPGGVGNGQRGIRLWQLPLMAIVSVPENGVPQHFYVVRHSAYATDRTLLLRRYIHSDRQWHSSDVNEYSTCTLDAWLNGAYFNSLPTVVRGQIAAVAIPYHSRSNGNAVIDLSRKAFVLSGTELGQTSATMAVTGTALANANQLKIATDSSGTAKTQWTRSSGTNLATYAFYLGAAGDLGGLGCTNSFGVRPAFTLPALTLLSDTPNADGSFNLIP